MKGPHISGKSILLSEKDEFTLDQEVITPSSHWHCMGDRIEIEKEGWWYKGRQFLSADIFELEQKIFHFLGHSNGFIHELATGEYAFYGALPLQPQLLQREFPRLESICQVNLVHDRRHRSQIDQKETLKSLR